MAGQCSTLWCVYYAHTIPNATFCPLCSAALTPIIPSYAACQPIDAGVALSSLIPSSPWDPTPVLSEQMEHVSNSGDMCSPAVSGLGATLYQTPIINSIHQGLSDTRVT